jgi:hypothetical protein
MLVLTPAQCDLAGETSGLWASHLPEVSADGADKMVEAVPPWRSRALAYLIISHRNMGRQLGITSHRVDLFVFASFGEAVRNGRYAGVR